MQHLKKCVVLLKVGSFYNLVFFDSSLDYYITNMIDGDVKAGPEHEFLWLILISLTFPALPLSQQANMDNIYKHL